MKRKGHTTYFKAHNQWSKKNVGHVNRRLRLEKIKLYILKMKLTREQSID